MRWLYGEADPSEGLGGGSFVVLVSDQVVRSSGPFVWVRNYDDDESGHAKIQTKRHVSRSRKFSRLWTSYIRQHEKCLVWFHHEVLQSRCVLLIGP